MVIAATVAGCGSGSHASRVPQPKVLRVALTNKGCSPKRLAAKSGPMRFLVKNSGTKRVSELEVLKMNGVLLGERENIFSHESGSFSLRLRPGHYILACPLLPYGGGDGTLVVTGARIRDAAAAISLAARILPGQLYRPLARYRGYVAALLATTRTQLATLALRLREGNLDGARSAWLAAHLSWLRLGQDDGAYGAFGNLGNRIDGTADGDPGTTSSPSFTGFHRVELDLWRRHDLAAARADTATLTRLVASLDQRKVDSDLPRTKGALNSWVLRCHEILEDAQRDSLSQNDNYGSNTDLASIRADADATREMLSVLAGLIEPRAPGLVATAKRQLLAIDSALAAAHARTEPANLPLRTRQRINATVGAALETLAPVSELMEVA